LGNLFLSVLLAFFTPVRPYLIQATVNIAIGKQVTLPSWVHVVLPRDAFGNAIQLILAISLFQVAFIIAEPYADFFLLLEWLG
jgi:ATP-binding cassette subfamily B protein